MTDKPGQWGTATFTVRTGSAERFTVTVMGRDRWALEMLMRTGTTGRMPIARPAPRRLAYVFKRRARGAQIGTVYAGPFAGTHRYVPRNSVTMLPAAGREAA
jgi:hypothetical protein